MTAAVAPLTPADCDLRDFAFMPLDTVRLLDSDLFALATGDEFKAALTLWCKSWQQIPAGSLPSDDRVLAHLSGAGSRWKKVKDIALRGFVLCDDGRLYHPVVAEKANEAWSKKQSYRARSKKGNEKRWASQKDEQEQSESDPLGTAESVLQPPKGQGQEQEDIPLANANGHEASKKAPEPNVAADAETHLWDTGKRFLGSRGVAQSKVGGLIGKWKRDYGTASVIEALGVAQTEPDLVDPVPFIEKVLKRRHGDDPGGFSIGGVRMSSPC
ncbi:MAG: DUF1376 domain-containing protein [Pseudomonadota bacterium]